MTELIKPSVKSKLKDHLPEIITATCLAGTFALGITYVVIKTKQGMSVESSAFDRVVGQMIVLEKIGHNCWIDVDTGLEYALDMLSDA